MNWLNVGNGWLINLDAIAEIMLERPADRYDSQSGTTRTYEHGAWLWSLSGSASERLELIDTEADILRRYLVARGLIPDNQAGEREP